MKKIMIIALLMFLTGCNTQSISKEYDSLLIIEEKVFSENFESGSIDKIEKEIANKGSMVVMKDFKDKSNNMLKVTLENGDIVNNGNRSEFKKSVDEKRGDELVYKVDFMIDKQYKDNEKEQMIFQLHDQPDFKNNETWETYSENPIAPPFVIEYINNNLRINIFDEESKVISQKQIEKDTWYTLTVHVLYEYDGFVEVFLDGESLTQGKVNYPTIYNDSANYVKIGLYRDPSIEERGVVYFDNFEIFKK